MSKIFTIVGMCVGALGIILGIAMIGGVFSPSFSYSIGNTYGADFYTDIAGSAAYAVNNISDLGETVEKCIGILVLVLGAIALCSFGSKLEIPAKKEAAPQKTQANVAAAVAPAPEPPAVVADEIPASPSPIPMPANVSSDEQTFETE